MDDSNTYHWPTPGAWLDYHITRLRDSGSRHAATDLAVVARRLAAELDPDTVQDLFQDLMDEDGYFQPEGSTA